MNIVPRIEAWAIATKIAYKEPCVIDYVANITEECGEWLLACKQNDETERIDAVADIFIFSITELIKYDYDIAQMKMFTDGAKFILNWYLSSAMGRNDFNYHIISHLSNIDKLSDPRTTILNLDIMANFAVTQMITMGYDHFKVIDEVLKVIESRDGEWSREQGKWLKDMSVEAQAKWHVPDYSNCKLAGVLL